MLGLSEFLATFGKITLTDVIYFILAIVFLIGAYKKINKYICDRHDAEQQRDQKLEEALSAVKQYPTYRKQSLEVQQRLHSEIEELRTSVEDNSKRLVKMEEESRKRELNKLRETLLQNYKYYTDVKKNPLQAWTKMEADAFWASFTDYEDLDGNGYMHTEVQPKMQLLTVIHMHDKEGISSLMSSRQ